MLLQVSSRTDICALYPKWLINRLKAGYVLVRNPYNPQQVSYIEINKQTVDCIAFMTKDPLAIMPYLNEIEQLGYKYFFMVTITPYDYDLEPGLRPKLEIIKTFNKLSRIIGKKRVIWRYDPILLNPRYSITFHLKMFEKMCQLLSPYTNIVIISFIDIYHNIVNEFEALHDQEVYFLAANLGKIAKKYHLEIQTCSEKYQLEAYGIKKGSCLNRQYIEDLIGYPLKIKTNSNRTNCSCLASIDIGAYSCCNHGCKYCYANNKKLVIQNIASHDENSAMLLGHLKPDDKVIKRKVSSNIEMQLKFDL